MDTEVEENTTRKINKTKKNGAKKTKKMERKRKED